MVFSLLTPPKKARCHIFLTKTGTSSCCQTHLKGSGDLPQCKGCTEHGSKKTWQFKHFHTWDLNFYLGFYLLQPQRAYNAMPEEMRLER